MIVSNVGAGKILVFDRRQFLANLLPLYVAYISQHAQITEVAL